jgi:hypothetical protein
MMTAIYQEILGVLTGPVRGTGEARGDGWAVKRPRGYVPAAARGDLEGFAAAAAAVAGAFPQHPPRAGAAAKAPRSSPYRCALRLLKP